MTLNQKFSYRQEKKDLPTMASNQGLSREDLGKLEFPMEWSDRLRFGQEGARSRLQHPSLAETYHRKFYFCKNCFPRLRLIACEKRCDDRVAAKRTSSVFCSKNL